jgi:hypothetical protein
MDPYLLPLLHTRRVSASATAGARRGVVRLGRGGGGAEDAEVRDREQALPPPAAGDRAHPVVPRPALERPACGRGAARFRREQLGAAIVGAAGRPGGSQPASQAARQAASGLPLRRLQPRLAVSCAHFRVSVERQLNAPAFAPSAPAPPPPRSYDTTPR